MTTSAPRVSSPYRFFIWIGFVIILFLAFMRLVLPGLLSSAAPAPSLPKYRQVPPFSLTERSGRTITNDHLAGKITVIECFFTTCPGPCPIMSRNMAKLQSVFAQDDRVQLVSLSIDPEDDTPTVLTAYAQRYGAYAQRWWFLTGPEKEIYDLVHQGFTQIVTDNRHRPLQDGEYLFTHSTRLTVVDGDGWVRAFPDGVTDEGRLETIKIVRQLEREGK